jgi:Calx-beta domain/Domain of unknown function (DUF4114)
MNFSNISQKTTFAPEFNQIVTGTTSQKTLILEAMKKAYEKSPIAKKMFDDWISTTGNTIQIKYEKDKFGSDKNTKGVLVLDLSYLNSLNYVNNNGTPVSVSLIGALTHEFGHALKNLKDPEPITDKLTDYRADNIPFVNTIWKQLGLQPMVSYLGTGSGNPDKPGYQKLGYAYTNGKPIDAAVNVEYVLREQSSNFNWDSSALDSITYGGSRDLLIGGSASNILKSGGGNDFLFGGGGDDTLNGGDGLGDTAVYFGFRKDYKIYNWFSDTWYVEHINGDNTDGKDTLTNIEFLQFADPKNPGKNVTRILSEDGIREKNDLAVVLDTTGSIGRYARGLQSTLHALFHDGVFANGNDGRAAIVLFKDSTQGESSTVLLPFTNQTNFADRESATIAAIDNLIDMSGYGYGTNETYFKNADGDLFGGGGDEAETPFDGLRLALEGAIGQWRTDAEALRIVLFTDAPAKDYGLATYITSLAHNIGATIGTNTSVALAGGSVDTFNLKFSSNNARAANLTGVDALNDPLAPLVAADNSIDPNSTTAQVQIFTVYLGASDTDTAALEAISRDNGGTFLAGLSENELLQKLIEIVNTPPVNLLPTISIIASDPDAAETTVDALPNPGQFTLTRTGDLTQSLTVAYTLSGTASDNDDYQSILDTVTFNPGEDTATIELAPIDDNLYEGDETVTLTLIDGGTDYQLSPIDLAATVTITDNDTQPIISIANITQTEGNIGMTNYGFNLTLSNPSVETITVDYSTADGTATAGSDYTAATGKVTFNPGETSKTIEIAVNGDTALERDETFAVNLTNPIGSTLDRVTGVGTIFDDDRPIVALNLANTSVDESNKKLAQFNLTRIGTLTQALTVGYTIAGTATNESDYKKLTGTATFKAGSAQATIDVKPIDDKIYEGNETVILTLNDSGTTYKPNPISNTRTLTIIDDDLPSIYLKVTDDKAAETAIGQLTNPGQFTIKRTGSTTDVLTVNYSLNGTANNGIDYQKLGTSITFASGSDTAIIDIKPIDDKYCEGTETVILKLSASSNYTIDEAKSGTIKIIDNDRPRDRDGKDLVLNVENWDDFNPRIGTGLQSGSEGEVIDLRGFDGRTLKVDTLAVGDSGYRNYIGFYAVEDAQGTLANGLKVSDPGYAEAAIRSAVLRSSKNETQLDRLTMGGSILAPVVIANGTFDEYLNRNPQNIASSDIHAYFNYIGANPDRVDHFRLLGDNKFGVEDMFGGGDRDYNDIVFQMTVKS